MQCQFTENQWVIIDSNVCSLPFECLCKFFALHWLKLMLLCRIVMNLVTVRTNESLKKRKEKKEKKSFKSHIAQDKHLNSVSLPIYRESSFLLFSLPQLRSISSTFLSPSHISADAFPANFSLFLSIALKFWLPLRVTF